MTLVVRSTTNPASIVTAVANAVHEVDRDIPVRDIFTMQDLVENSLTQQRFNMLLLGVFAGLALLLAAIGIYSVLSYSVKRRVQEIGIRLALGARIGDVLRMVIVEGMKPTLLGVVIGTVGALAMGHVLSSLIYGVKPTDPVTFLVVAVLLAAIALFATIIPAYRAANVDPLVALGRFPSRSHRNWSRCGRPAPRARFSRWNHRIPILWICETARSSPSSAATRGTQ